jgi:hypothetical protein
MSTFKTPPGSPAITSTVLIVDPYTGDPITVPESFKTPPASPSIQTSSPTKATRRLGRGHRKPIGFGKNSKKKATTTTKGSKKKATTTAKDSKNDANTTAEDSKNDTQTTVEDSENDADTTVEDSKNDVNTTVEDSKNDANTTVEDSKNDAKTNEKTEDTEKVDAMPVDEDDCKYQRGYVPAWGGWSTRPGGYQPV